MESMRRALRIVVIAVVMCGLPVAAVSAADQLSEARSAYEKRDYAKAVTLLDALIGKGSGPSGALELRVRAHIKLNAPGKAVEISPADALMDFGRKYCSYAHDLVSIYFSAAGSTTWGRRNSPVRRSVS